VCSEESFKHVDDGLHPGEGGGLRRQKAMDGIAQDLGCSVRALLGRVVFLWKAGREKDLVDDEIERLGALFICFVPGEGHLRSR
jgi:hypothetical protein